MRTLSLLDAAVALGVAPRSLADKRYRQRIGLAGRHIGRRLVFAENDVAALLERAKEKLVSVESRRGPQ
jgi:hypothetical protein